MKLKKLDFTYNNNGTSVAVYKKHLITVHNDINPINPFDEWDCEPPLAYQSFNHFARSYREYGNLSDSIVLLFTSDIVLQNIKQALELYCDITGDKWRDFVRDSYQGRDEWLDNMTFRGILAEDIYTGIIDALNDTDSDYFNYLETICDLLDIPCLNRSSSGYSQGEYVDVFIALTPGFFKITGCDVDDSEKILSGSLELFSAYMWGDVYGYSIDGRYSDGSCYGFYGNDFDDSGLAENAMNDIDCSIRYANKKKQAKLKQLIKSNVSINRRSDILEVVK